MNRSFVWGVIVGAGGLWAFHRYVKAVPSTKS
jgi:hypothetical protein